MFSGNSNCSLYSSVLMICPMEIWIHEGIFELEENEGLKEMMTSGKNFYNPRIFLGEMTGSGQKVLDHGIP